MTYAVGERVQPGPAGTQEAAQGPGGESGLGRIPAGVPPINSGADVLQVCPSGQTQRPSSLTAANPVTRSRGMGKAGQLKTIRLRMAPAHYFDGFGPVYLDRMQGGAAAPRVPCRAFSLNLAADASSVGGPFSE